MHRGCLVPNVLEGAADSNLFSDHFKRFFSCMKLMIMARSCWMGSIIFSCLVLVFT
jgi:hypothetical protein